jgi:septum formation protein
LVYSDTAKVSFDKLKDDEINFYIDKYAPFDKAGSYGIQEWIGYIGINRIEGSFYTVMGLPTHLLWGMLKRIIMNYEL